MDEIKEAPSDIRHYEFIKYQLENHEDFLSKIDNALTNVFIEDYELLHEKALEILREFNDQTESNMAPIKKDLFIARVMTNERKKPIPDFAETIKLKQFAISLIIDITADVTIMGKITEWLTGN